MRQLHSNKEGIEGIPLKLLIAAIVMGISIPAIMGLWVNLEKEQVGSSIQSQLTYLSIRISQVYRGGPGNIAIVDLNLKSGMFTSIGYILIGDNLESIWRSTIRWKLSDGAEKILPLEGDAPVCTVEGLSLRLEEGWHSLYLETKKKESGLVFVEAARLD